MRVIEMKFAMHQIENIDGKLRQLGARIQRVDGK
jgi:hypothetical protein